MDRLWLFAVSNVGLFDVSNVGLFDVGQMCLMGFYIWVSLDLFKSYISNYYDYWVNIAKYN